MGCCFSSGTEEETQPLRYDAPPPVFSPPPAGLTPGRLIQLRSLATGQCIRICQDGRVDALGGGGKFAQFIVAPNHGFIRFQNVYNPGVYLAIRNGQVTFGEGMGHCEFFVNSIGPDIITLKAAHEAGGMGFHANGMPKEAWTTHDGTFGQFQIVYL
eukprot:m.919973 g.919973  ORF g.919973 m.919973 type:complete len:157 (+) comp60598_c0_seq1:296-766(+)